MKLINALTVSLTVASSIGFAGQAEVRSINCNGLAKVVCQAAINNAQRAPYRGPIRPANEPMACARTVSYGAKPSVWVDATHATQWRDGTEIAATAIVYTEPFPLVQGWVITESCIPRRLLHNVRKLVLCTGLYEEGFHWNLTPNELNRIKRTGHFSDYVPFLKKRDQSKVTPSQTRAAYKVRYGI